MDGMVETAYRTLLGLAFLLLFTKVLGKKQLGELTYFNYATSIAFGNIVGEMIIHYQDVSLPNGIVAVVIWALLILGIEFLVKRSPKAKLALESEPAIVIKKGLIMQDTLNQLNLGIDDLCMLLRNKEIFTIAEVDYAIFEPNGQLSVMKKAADSAPVGTYFLPSELIVDGKLMRGNLKEYGLNEKWVQSKLHKAGIASSESVFLAQLQEDGTLYIAPKDNTKPLII
ncbi:Uncharacterized membrane protein YcaP, DUF421 family [Fictibacillus solisalsi]|uniref:Uncharacterized membrane protein YcaP, DUF421 family n=1 Tax=Fictibacillus solisalsi TaxID=459525 RepID=A0A1H0AYH6_9BACL|nr:DUF421 domain-containing protein [Fictibacillus solisalsi]SDN38492.1 Uncharacterized membrane protein YcaP, DUF421 family [Fictibacillus solisalsi]